MTRLLKIAAWTLGALILLVVVAIISLALIIDPNDYRDEIATLVQKRTGRTLEIRGDLKLSFFPWLGVNAGVTRLSNAPGFGPEPFAQFEQAKVAVKLLPLLFHRRMELDTVELDKLRLHLVRRRDGRTNWDDLVARAQQAPTEAETPGRKPEDGAPLALRLRGVQVREAQVTWQDETVNRTARADHLNLSTGALDLTKPVTLDLESDFSLSAPEAAGHVSFKGTLHHDEKAQRYRTENLRLALDARGGALPGGAARVTLTGDASADLKNDTAEVKALRVEGYGARFTLNASASSITNNPAGRGDIDLELREPEALTTALAGLLPEKLKAEPRRLAGTRLAARFEFARESATLSDMRATALGLQLTGNARAQGLTTAPQVQGELQVAPFVPRDLFDRLGITPPKTADATALTKASLATRFAAGVDRAALDNLVVRLDQSTLTGRVAAPRFTPLQLRYDLTLDRLDLDRYLPPPTKGEKPAPPATAAATQPRQLPLKALRALDIDGTLRVGKLKAANLNSSEILATLRAKGGAFRLHPLNARLYDGTYTGDLGLDVRGHTPLLSMNERLTAVQVGPLLQDFMGKPHVTGKAALTARLTARGTNAMQIRRSLNGRGTFQFLDGTVNGINLGQLLRDAYARYKGQPAPPTQNRKTDFAELRGSVLVNDGLVTNKDLVANSPLLRVTGQGSAHLVSEKIDYRVTTVVTTAFRELAAIQGTPIPVQITGTFAEPRFGVDVGAVLQGRAGKALEDEKKKLEKDARKRLENELKNLLNK